MLLADPAGIMQSGQGISHQPPQYQLPPVTGLDAGNEVLQALPQLGQLQIAPAAPFVRNSLGDVARPTFGCIKRDHANPIGILAVDEVGDDRLQVRRIRPRA